jgi:hypothetical protein
MSGAEAAGANDQAPTASDPQALMDALTFDSDVKEVFLLIDHISGRSEKSLKDLDTSGIELPEQQNGAAPVPGLPPAGADAVPVPPPPRTAQAATSDKPAVSDVLHRLCQIGYPPHPDATTKAHKAAFVLLLKDRLNELATPARGITIAYTAMFVTATYGCSFVPWRRAGAAGTPSSSRGDLARGAYPTLEGHARCFARLFRWFPWLMLFVLILTASAYWDVGFGRTIVQRIEQIDKQRLDLLHPDVKTAPGAVALDQEACMAKAGPPADMVQACGPLVHLVDELADSRQDLYNFAKAAAGQDDSNLVVHILAWIRPMSWGFALDGQEPPSDRPEASVAWVLSLFSTYVLPAMFGLIGTLAAMMRAIQAKVRDSLLGPRDLALTALGLVIGPVAGLAVGLFYTPTGATTGGTAGLAGSVSLSASGLGFLAGYGADAFFKFVDALLIRVFALDQPGK